jgi:methionyl-tRNA formyltransferase
MPRPVQGTMTSPNRGSAAPVRRLRVVFLGTPELALPVFTALLDAPKLEVVLAVTQPDRPAGRGRQLTPPPVKRLAEERGVPVFQPERLRGAETLDRLRAVTPDLFVITAYGQILRQAVLDIPPLGCLNVHPSLLPRHRGPAPIAAAIMAGDEETGVTIMLTDRGMDTGPILMQTAVPLPAGETTASLTPQLIALGAELLLQTIPAWASGGLTPIPQDEALATYSRTFTREDGLIVWERAAREIARQIRALNPWPRAFTFTEGKRLLLLNAREETIVPLAAGIVPGTVVADAAGGLLVATGEGLLRVLEVQPEGRQAVAAETYLPGQRALTGRVLGVAG